MEASAPALSAYGREVKTPFGLLGTDERALTFALAYTMHQCPRLLQRFLSAIGVKRLRLDRLSAAKISLETRRDLAITDIEILIPDLLHVIIEAKVGLNLPTLEQLRKYIGRLEKSSASVRKLVMLLSTDYLPVLDHYRRQDEGCRRFLDGFSWPSMLEMKPSLLDEFSRNSLEGSWIRTFFDFMQGEFNMKTYTNEVWIVPAQKTPLWKGGWSFYDTHFKGRIYYRAKKDRYTNHIPLYIALRGGGMVAFIQRVLKIEHGVNPVEYCPQLENVKASWPREPHTIWHLSEPLPLPKPIPTGDRFIRGRHVFCDIDILLSSSSVRDIAERMKLRRTPV